MGIEQYIGFSGAGLSEHARAHPDAVYVSAYPEQHLSYLRDTVIEELAFSLEQRGISVSDMEQRCVVAARSMGIDDLLERNPAQLSGGQTRRVVIAAALALKPRRLVLDDPFSGLDVGSKKRLRSLLGQLARSTEIHLYGYSAEFDEWPIHLIGEDPRTYTPPPATTVSPQDGSAWQGSVTGTRGKDKRWWRASSVSFLVGPVELAIPAGGVLWLRGANGSGKSTLLRALANEHGRGALLTQDPHDQVLHSSVADMYPGGEDVHPYDLPSSTLRLAQLRMIMRLGRPVLLLDEPEVGLDPRGRFEAQELIRQHLSQSGHGVVLVTHDGSFASGLGVAMSVANLD